MSTAPAAQTVALNQLRISPKNTRQRRDPEAIEAMAASILHHGLLQNLIVEPAANGPARRYRRPRWRSASCAAWADTTGHADSSTSRNRSPPRRRMVRDGR